MALTKADMKYLVSLQTKKGRAQKEQFLAEGVRLLEEALAADYLPAQLFYAPSELSLRGEQLVRDFIGHGVAAETISARECHRVADTETSQGIIGLFDLKQTTLENVSETYRRVLICDGIADPGNLGTLMRTARALGFELVIATEGSAETASPKTIRATMGTFFTLTVIGGATAAAIAAWLKKGRYAVYHADSGGNSLDVLPPVSGRAALIIGAEATGAGRILTEAADVHIAIPMSGGTESLNAAVAGGILMYWMQSAERKQP